MNEIGGFPFVVARGRRVGQRTILAPDFLIETNSSGLLRDSITERLASDKSPYIIEVSSASLGPMTLVYRFTKVSSEVVYGLGQPGDSLLRDRSGRPIEIAYGLVFRGPSSIVSAIDDMRFEILRTEAFTVFAEFINSEDTWTLGSSSSHSYQTRKEGLAWQGDATTSITEPRHRVKRCLFFRVICFWK